WMPAPPMDLSKLKFTPVSRMEATEVYPTWSQDGKSIAFIADVHGISQVFTKIIDSPVASEAAQITNAPFPCTEPFWSRDSSKIYYSSENKLWSVPASGGAPIVEYADSGPGTPANSRRVSMHPDGKTVVFT